VAAAEVVALALLAQRVHGPAPLRLQVVAVGGIGKIGRPAAGFGSGPGPKTECVYRVRVQVAGAVDATGQLDSERAVLVREREREGRGPIVLPASIGFVLPFVIDGFVLTEDEQFEPAVPIVADGVPPKLMSASSDHPSFQAPLGWSCHLWYYASILASENSSNRPSWSRATAIT
jgi:hypothetical protein